MANYIDFHRDCPNCGSHDALTVFSDGGAKCFSCGWSWKDFYGKHKQERKSDDDIMKEIVEDAGRFPSAGIPDRFLTADTCKFYGVKVIVRDGGIAQHIYPYCDHNGEIVAQKIRTVDGKQFNWRGNATRAQLFGQNLFPAKGRFITITEGEIDAMSVYQMSGGKSAVVSVKGGAESALKEVKQQYQYLDSFENIIICFDGDKAGINATIKASPILIEAG